MNNKNRCLVVKSLYLDDDGLPNLVCTECWINKGSRNWRWKLRKEKKMMCGRARQRVSGYQVIAIVPAWQFVHIQSCQLCVKPWMFCYLEMVGQSGYGELLLFLMHFRYCIVTIPKSCLCLLKWVHLWKSLVVLE